MVEECEVKILLINLVRQIYWFDRENIELQILKNKLMKRCGVKILTISEDYVDSFEREKSKYKDFDACVFWIDFNTDSRIFDRIFQISQFIKRENQRIINFMIGQRSYLHSDSILKECPIIDYIIDGDPEDIDDIILNICYGDRSYSKTIKIHCGQNDLIRPSRSAAIVSELKFAKIRTTRGCYGDCRFCIDKDGIGIKKIRNIDDVIDEIRDVTLNCNIKKICIYDNSFEDPCFEDKSRIREFLSKIEQYDLKLYFDCSVRAETFKTEEDLELLKRMSRCGFYKIVVGFESGNQEDLSFYHKRAVVEDNIRMAQYLSKANINYIMPPGFIMFNPFTTVKKLEKNYEFLKGINKGYCFFAFCSFLKVFPNSRMHNYLLENKVTCEVESYRELVRYEYVNKEIQDFAEFLFEKRYSSNTLCIGMKIDNIKDLICQVTKYYVEWRNVEELIVNINTISNLLEDEISSFWEYSIHNLNNMEEIEKKYYELEECSKKLNPQKYLKRFLASNYNQEELYYLI